MFKKNDSYTFQKFCSLIMKKTTETTVNGVTTTTTVIDKIGSVFTEFQVMHYDDIQLQNSGSVRKDKTRKYYLLCTQRINIYNKYGMNLNPNTEQNSYEDYPALISAAIKMPVDLDFQLIDYSPQTINTKVQQSGTTGSQNGTTSGTTTNSTVGSSMSETNTYGASVSVTAGGVYNSGVTSTSSFEHSSTVTHEQSKSNGTEKSNSLSNESSSSASMSIKDWGAYALVNPNTKNPSWIFGQEFPWDAIECRKTTNDDNANNKNQVKMVIPSAMSTRLYDGVCLYPPSHLSSYGINFVMKTNSLVTITNGAADEISIQNAINYYSASHYLKNISTDPKTEVNAAVVYMDKIATSLDVVDSDYDKDVYEASDDRSFTTINLALMALDTIGLSSRAAIIGFIPSKFIVMPVPATTTTNAIPFKIISSANDLMIQDTTNYNSGTAGSGFTASETCLEADLNYPYSGEQVPRTTTLEMTVYFKVIDSVSDYTLFMKHWKKSSTGVKLTLEINNDSGNPIVKYVDALEAEGGENNLLSIALRNQDFASVDYHDYLQLGLNAIKITIQPNGSSADCVYQIRAISVEKS
jgi:hypothetical protein